MFRPMLLNGTGTSRRACLYLRASTAVKSMDGDILTFDNDPVTQDSRAGSGRLTCWILHKVCSHGQASRRSDEPARTPSWPMPGDAFEMVVVFRFDQFARSVKQLVLALKEFQSLGMREAMFAINRGLAQREHYAKWRGLAARIWWTW